MSGEAVAYGVASGVATITIDREERRNAIDTETAGAISSALTRAEEDESIRVVVLTGAGERAFCAGGDLGGMPDAGPVQQHYLREELGALLSRMRASRLPTVARVNGQALAGGFGLMLACDLVVASSDAEMGTPEIDVGLWPFMITAVLQRDVPRKLALDLMLTGRRIDAEEAQRWGFVNRVVARAELDGAVEELCAQLAAKSPVIVELGKRSFYRAEDMSFDDALAYLSGMLTVCLGSEDAVEGVTAFMQKRPPQWKGR